MAFCDVSHALLMCTQDHVRHLNMHAGENSSVKDYKTTELSYVPGLAIATMQAIIDYLAISKSI